MMEMPDMREKFDNKYEIQLLQKVQQLEDQVSCLVQNSKSQTQTQMALIKKLAKTEWQPIESAPMDGKSILVTDGFEVCDAYFRGGDWWQYECGDDWYSTSINPTHWMPLPEPPTIDEAK